MKKVLTLLSVGLIVVSMLSMVSTVRAQPTNLPRIGNWRPGDAHVHSVHSHCPVWDINPIGTTANDAANSDLDWIIFTDHSYDMDATEWQQALGECNQAETSTFKVLCGEELSVDEGGTDVNAGHYLTYGLNHFIENSGGPPLSPWWPHEPHAQGAIDEVNSQEGVGFIAHPYNSLFELVGEWDWDSWDVASGYTGIEVWNGGMSTESPDDDAMAKWNSLLVDGLTSGRHVVGIGNSDAHPRDPPIVDPEHYEPSVWTYLLLPSLTHVDIVDAYKGGHAVFTNGPLLVFKINQKEIGETVNKMEGSSVTMNLQWDSSGFGEMQEVTIRKITPSGSTNYPIPVSGTSGSTSWTDPTPVVGPCCYRLEGRSVEDRWPWPDETFRVYTNPIWIRATNEITDAILVNTDSLITSSTSGDTRAFNVFTSPVGFLTATEGDTFLIESTGIAASIPGSPEHFESTDFDGGGTPGDTVSLTLRLLVPDGATTLSFDFRFMSEEYPEFVGSAYNDFFYAYLTNSTGTHQVAFDDNGHIINVNNNFFSPNIYPIGTVFDGATKRLTTTVNVKEGEMIMLKFIVGDVGDGIYDTAVFLDNVRFNVGGGGPGTTPTADVIVVKNGPNSVEKGKQFTYTINYFNIEEAAAQNVVVTDNLPSQVAFVSASAGGIYSSTTHSVTWNLGTLQPFSSGSLTLTVSVPSTVSVGTVLQNSVSITTTSQESNSNNNQNVKSTTVTAGTSFPPNVEVGPTVSNYNGIPVLYWTTPTTFTYHGDATVIGVDINIHLPDGGPDISGQMTNVLGTYDWKFTYTFYPRHGQGTVTYTVHYADGQQSTTAHSILVDPSGYVYNSMTGQRIQGATVTLYRFNVVLQQFALIAPDDPGIDPHINPQITDENGGYGWMVSLGMYMVKAEKTGYATNFVIITVPPAATDLNIALTPIDVDPPTTKILIGEPYYIDASDNTYVTSATSFTLIADDGPDGSGVAATYYRQYNVTYDSNWKEQPNPFYMTGLDDGGYSIDYYSTDVAGNVESTNTQDVILDNTAPQITVSNPPAGCALQDGVTFIASTIDASGTSSLNFSIREENNGEGIPVGFDNLPATYNSITGTWTLTFNTLQLPDGYYIALVKAKDNLGHEGSTIVSYSIRNWAVLKLLPATQNNKAGRTMPVKFALRVAASVDPSQPFVYNEELTIMIYATSNPSNILQTSTFGDTARDYRIISVSELYITNFQTLKTTMQYRVSVYRGTFRIDYFNFATVK